jgi:hypothetical protein
MYSVSFVSVSYDHCGNSTIKETCAIYKLYVICFGMV